MREGNYHRLTKEQVVTQAISVHGDRYDYSRIYLTRSNSQIIINNIICKTHGYFSSRKSVHVQQGCQCPECSGYNNRKSAEQWKQELIARGIERFGDRFDYSLVEYKNRRTPVKIRCREHNYIFETRLDDHTRKAGCCPFCSASAGEADIRKWLDDNNIVYTTQHQIPNDNPQCVRKYFTIDFYLPEYNTFIEFNGGQHYMYVPHFNTEEWTFEQQQLRDKLVREYCKQNNVHLIEIRYDEQDNIGEILAKELNISK